MSDTKKCFLSALLSIVFSASLLVGFSYVDKSSNIHALFLKVNAPVYLKDQRVMNEEMAVIMLPLLKKQKKDEDERNRIKKPDMVYAPEQLQNSRGY
ncbi:hypothetical protein ACI0X9_003952 [Cronobacter turicensis]